MKPPTIARLITDAEADALVTPNSSIHTEGPSLEEQIKGKMTDDPLDRVDEFFSEVRTRLLKGKREYDDKSFSANPWKLLEEISQELFDMCGWSYILYCRIQKMRVELLFSKTQSVGTDGLRPTPIPRFPDPFEHKDPFTGVVTEEPLII